MIDSEIYRIIDVNLNRAKEGLRIVEDIIRFILKDEKLTLKVKELRHKADEIFSYIKIEDLLKNRDIESDFGKDTDEQIYQRENIKEFIVANLKRVQESFRVIEEFSRLISPQLSKKYKESRFLSYQIEKEIISKLL